MRGAIGRYNRNIKQAHDIHSKAIQPYLQQAIDLIKEKQLDQTVLDEIKLIDKKWRKYCTRYVATHKTHAPNRDAFQISISHWIKENIKKNN